MFKTIFTAAAFTLTAGLATAAQPPLILSPAAATTAATTANDGTALLEQVNNYCEWVTLYDAWGNWVTVWQCY